MKKIIKQTKNKSLPISKHANLKRVRPPKRPKPVNTLPVNDGLPNPARRTFGFYI